MINLHRNNLPLNWSVFYTGVNKKYVPWTEILAFINKNYKSIPDSVLLELNLAHAEEEFTALLENLAKQEALEGIKVSSKDAERIWQLDKLIEISRNNQSIKHKLQDIDLYWAQFDYPESWENFIYYMPNQDDDGSTIKVYNSFLDFIDSEKRHLSKITERYPATHQKCFEGE